MSDIVPASHVEAQPRPLQSMKISRGRVGAADLDAIWRLAGVYNKCKMLPAGIKSQEQMHIALLAGYEAGLSLTAAAKSVMVVNNRPTIWGDGAIGLVRASGLCEYLKEWHEGEGDKRTAFAETKRKGEIEPERRTFSMADARKARLLAKGGPWTDYPDRMLSARARSFLIRDVYGDVLMGLTVREEADDLVLHREDSSGVAESEAQDIIDSLPMGEGVAALPSPEHAEAT